MPVAAGGRRQGQGFLPQVAAAAIVLVGGVQFIALQIAGDVVLEHLEGLHLHRFGGHRLERHAQGLAVGQDGALADEAHAGLGHGERQVLLEGGLQAGAGGAAQARVDAQLEAAVAQIVPVRRVDAQAAAVDAHPGVLAVEGDQAGGVLGAHQGLGELHQDLRLRVAQGARRGDPELAGGGHRIAAFAALVHVQGRAVPGQGHRRRVVGAADAGDHEFMAEAGGVVLPGDLQVAVALGGAEHRLGVRRVGPVPGAQGAAQLHGAIVAGFRGQGVHAQTEPLGHHGDVGAQRRQAVVDPGKRLGEQGQGQGLTGGQRLLGPDFQAVAGGEHRLEGLLRGQPGDAFGGLVQTAVIHHRMGEPHHQRRPRAHRAVGPAVQVVAPARIRPRRPRRATSLLRRAPGIGFGGLLLRFFRGRVAGQQGQSQKQHATMM